MEFKLQSAILHYYLAQRLQLTLRLHLSFTKPTIV